MREGGKEGKREEGKEKRREGGREDELGWQTKDGKRRGKEVTQLKFALEC